jgi:hypothetical protein
MRTPVVAGTGTQERRVAGFEIGKIPVPIVEAPINLMIATEF